jgi:hypothetical protein
VLAEGRKIMEELRVGKNCVWQSGIVSARMQFNAVSANERSAVKAARIAQLQMPSSSKVVEEMLLSLARMEIKSASDTRRRSYTALNGSNMSH